MQKKETTKNHSECHTAFYKHLRTNKFRAKKKKMKRWNTHEYVFNGSVETIRHERAIYGS